MKIQILHTGRVRNGKLIYDIPDLYNQEVLALEGKNFVLTLKEEHRKPTPSQYGYYRGCILPTCFESEHFRWMDNKDDIHDYYFVKRFLVYKKMVNIGGVPQEVTKERSLADLSRDEMTQFIDRVIAHCEAELFIEIPSPELYYNKYYQK